MTEYKDMSDQELERERLKVAYDRERAWFLADEWDTVAKEWRSRSYRVAMPVGVKIRYGVPWDHAEHGLKPAERARLLRAEADEAKAKASQYSDKATRLDLEWETILREQADRRVSKRLAAS